MKKKIVIIFITCISISILFIVYSSDLINNFYTASKVVSEIIDDSYYFGDNPAYNLGLNSKGKPIFKSPSKAYRQLKKECIYGLRAIRKEFSIELPLNRFNLKLYGIYGDQLTTEDKISREQGYRIAQFYDIYENSFQ